MINIYNQTQDDNNGRPRENNITNDNTLRSRGRGSNIAKGGKV